MLRILVSVLFILLLFNAEAASKEAEGTKLPHLKDRQYQYEVFVNQFNVLPSVMNLWNGSSWSTIEFNYNTYDGSYKSPQFFERGNSVSFTTESIMKIDSIGYTFYGKFNYVTNRDFNSSFNLFYNRADNGSPLYIFVPATGNWETQQYNLTGGVSKNLFNNRLLIGGYFNYSGNLYNRIIDVRNRQTNLSIDIYPSLTFNINKRNSFSLGSLFNRSKMEPVLNNYYPRAGDDSHYWVYINRGMGTNEQVPTGLGHYHNTSSYNLTGQWLWRTPKSNLSASFSYFDGSQVMTTKNNIPNTNEFRKLGKYEWTKLGGSIIFNHFKGNIKSLSIADAYYTDGTASTFNIQQDQYQRAYTYGNLNVNLKSSLYFASRILNYLSLSVRYADVSSLDLNYGQKADYTNITSTIGGSFFKTKLLKGYSYINLDLTGKFNIDYFHDPMSARTNVYTLNIAYPNLSYESSDYFMINPGITWERNFNKISVVLDIDGFMVSPTKINYPNQYTSFTLDDKMRFLSILFKIVF